jgi:hypothetical protein
LDLLPPPPSEVPPGTRQATEEVGLAVMLPPLQLLSLAPSVVRAAADVVGMFRTNYTMSSRTMSAQGTPLVAQVARTLQTSGSGVTVSVDGFATASPTSPLLTGFWDLDKERQDLTTASIGLRSTVAAKADVIAGLKKDREATATALLKVLGEEKPGDLLRQRLADLDARMATEQAGAARETAVLAVVDDVLGVVSAFTNAALTSPAGERAPLLSALARESIHEGDHGASHVLFVSLDSVGADVVSPASQLRNVEYVKYVGGMQMTFILYSVGDRKVVDSGVERRLKLATLDLDSGSVTMGAESELR